MRTEVGIDLTEYNHFSGKEEYPVITNSDSKIADLAGPGISTYEEVEKILLAGYSPLSSYFSGRNTPHITCPTASFSITP